jgi:hypothetical protein
MGIEAGAWEQEAKDLHPIHNIFMLRCDPHGVMGVNGIAAGCPEQNGLSLKYYSDP